MAKYVRRVALSMPKGGNNMSFDYSSLPGKDQHRVAARHTSIQLACTWALDNFLGSTGRSA